MNTRFALLLLAAATALLSGCSTVGYYSQSVIGHSQLMLARKPIDKVLKKSDDAKLQQQLRRALELRRYASERLALPDNDSYLAYVELDRKYPVWTVVAASEFSLRPEQWCYPIIGCAAYRGYFAQAAADKYAQGLREQGLETMVGGATAYSTLGWFDDPLTSAMLRHGEVYLAEIMFHELAHQQLYVNGNSSFNEAFATVVGEQGALQWLRENQPEKAAAYQQRLQVRNDFSAMIAQLKKDLAEVYSSNVTEAEKRAGKEQQWELARQRYADVKQQRWQGKGWYDAWFDKPINNARLAAIATYRDLVPAFEQLLQACDNDFARFYKIVAEQDGKGRDAVVAESCP